MEAAVHALADGPERWPLAPESDAFPRRQQIRQLLYGKRRNVYRVLYTIHADRVSVLHVRHAARDFLKP